jgi:drug/metabolite transporter (DMT)-like permease
MYALIFVSVLWALSFGLIKGQLTGIDPSLVAAIRLLLCFIVFLPFFRWQKIPEKYSHYFILGMIQFGIMYWAYIQSYQFLPGYLVAVFTIFTPFYVMIFDSLLQRRLILKQLLVVLCSILGAAIIVYKSPEQTDYVKGFLILQLANIVFAFGQVAYRYLNKANHHESHMTKMTIMYAGAATYSVVVILLNESYQGVSEITSQQWWVLIYLGVIASSIGFSLWNYGARQVSSAQLAIMNNGYIPVAVIFSLTLFGEQGDLQKLLIGGSIMVLSLWWSNKMTMK